MTVNCYGLTVTKTAVPTFTRTYGWAITKTVDVATWNLFAGQSATSHYTVTVTKDNGTDSAWSVTGVITVHNPAPMAATLTDLADSVGGVAATGELPAVWRAIADDARAGSAAGGTLVCTYSAGLPNGTSRTNTATATLAGQTYQGTAAVRVRDADDARERHGQR